MQLKRIFLFVTSALLFAMPSAYSFGSLNFTALKNQFSGATAEMKNAADSALNYLSTTIKPAAIKHPYLAVGVLIGTYALADKLTLRRAAAVVTSAAALVYGGFCYLPSAATTLGLVSRASSLMAGLLSGGNQQPTLVNQRTADMNQPQQGQAQSAQFTPKVHRTAPGLSSTGSRVQSGATRARL